MTDPLDDLFAPDKAEAAVVKKRGKKGLTLEDMKRIEEEAKVEFEAEEKAKLEKEFKAKIKADLKKKSPAFVHAKDLEPEEGVALVEVYVDLGPSAEFISLDGVRYYHGHTYSVTSAVASTITDTAYRTRMHELEIRGADTNAFYGRRPQNAYVN
jgi:hypothetical protein